MALVQRRTNVNVELPDIYDRRRTKRHLEIVPKELQNDDVWTFGYNPQFVG